MTASGVIYLKPNQHATFLVSCDFNYYVVTSQNSSLTLKSKTGNAINVNYNIWEKGT